MNSAKTLYSILNVLIILIAISIGIGAVLFLLMLFGLPMDFGINDVTVQLDKKDPILYVFLIIVLVIYSIFIYGLIKFRHAVKFLKSHDFYNNELIVNMILAGKCITLTGVLLWFVGGVFNMFFADVIKFGIGEKTFVYLFIIAMGLFMMLIGNIMNDAKKIKEENDLTI